MNSKYVIKQIAKGVGLAGAVGVVIVAPNATVALDKLAKIYSKKSKKSYPDYMKRTGYFEIEKVDNKFVIRLSEKGQQKAGSSLDDYEFDNDENWDGKWHLLMFDIPETHKRVRNKVQYKLKELGMRPVQNSVYVHYKSTNELAKAIRQVYPKVSTLVISATVEYIDGEEQLRKAFKLS